MSSTSPVDLVDAIVADLKANLSQKPKEWRSYAEPTVVVPERTPMCAVWCEVTDYRLISTMPAYDRNHQISIAWYVSNPKQSEVGGVGDPATVKALDQTVEAIVTRCADYSNGIPGLDTAAQLVVTLKSRGLAPQSGMIWRGLVELVASEAA